MAPMGYYRAVNKFTVVGQIGVASMRDTVCSH